MQIRKIKPEDNTSIATIIRQVMTEFGANGEGFSIHDDEVDDMYKNYSMPRAVYFVVEENGKVLGGAGIAQLSGGDSNTCELKKMYFLPSIRGRGAGQKIINLCLGAARNFSYKSCYLETLGRMEAANHLYTSNGFKKIDKPLGATGHHGCESFYIKNLE